MCSSIAWHLKARLSRPLAPWSWDVSSFATHVQSRANQPWIFLEKIHAYRNRDGVNKSYHLEIPWKSRGSVTLCNLLVTSKILREHPCTQNTETKGAGRHNATLFDHRLDIIRLNIFIMRYRIKISTNGYCKCIQLQCSCFVLCSDSAIDFVTAPLTPAKTKMPSWKRSVFGVCLDIWHGFVSLVFVQTTSGMVVCAVSYPAMRPWLVSDSLFASWLPSFLACALKMKTNINHRI